MRYCKKAVGNLCYLSPIRMEDAEKYVEWLNDIEITKYLIPQNNINIINEQAWINNMSSNSANQFAIIDIKTDTIIGNCGIHHINYHEQKATVGIFIGDKSFHGKGYGTEALSLLVDFGFNILNLHNISLEVFDYNRRAIRSYEKVGFKVFGRQREARQLGGKRYDVIWMDLLSTEFDSPYFKKKVEEN